MDKRFQAAFASVLLAANLCLPLAVSAKTPNDPYFFEQWHLAHIHAEAAWDVTTGSPDVIVAVIDTGVDLSNEDLKENIWTNAGELAGNGRDDDGNGYVDDVHGWNFVAKTNDVRPWGDSSDEEAFVHGTLVSSIIAAKGNNGVGISGIAWNAKIMPLVALAGDGTGSTSEVALAIRYAADNGASVVNLSIEGEIHDPELDEAIAYAAARGALTVTVAGNGEEQGRDLGTYPVYPACAVTASRNSTLTVTATDNADQKASFANYGACVDIAAPGVDIFGAVPASSAVSDVGEPYRGGFSGTSVAAPIVSGIAALLKSLHPTLGVAELRNRIKAAAVPIDGVNGQIGAGRVDAARALDDAYAAASSSVSDPSSVFAVPVSGVSALTLEGSLPGHSTRVRVSSAASLLEIAPFGLGDERGALVAFSDLDSDGMPEIAVVAASGTGNEVVVFSGSGTLRARVTLPGAFTQGALIAGTSDGFVVADPLTGRAWGIDRAFVVRLFFPYGEQYVGGMDLLAISGAAAFAPRNGGGRLVVSNAAGVQLVSAFPFGMEPSGRWSLARGVLSDGSVMLILSGLNGTEQIGSKVIGQIGWMDVAFSDLERMTLTLSDGRVSESNTMRIYDTWPRP